MTTTLAGAARSGATRSGSRPSGSKQPGLSGLILGLLIVVGGCTNDEQAASANETTAPVGEASDSAVAIEAEGCSLQPAVASGAVIEQPGLVVTVAHAVAGSNRITVIDHEGSRFPAVLRFLDPNSDIALLQVDDLLATPLTVSTIDPPVEGQLLVRDGTDGIESKPVSVTKRLVVTIEDIYIEDSVERTAFELEGEVTPGDSGGMVIVDGSVAAMVFARSRNASRGFALDEQELNRAIGEPDDRPDPEQSISSGRCVP